MYKFERKCGIIKLHLSKFEMGVSTIKQLLDIVEAEEFKRLLESQYNEYEEIHIEARKNLMKTDMTKKGLVL